MKGYLCVLVLGLLVTVRGSEPSSNNAETESKDSSFGNSVSLEKIKRGAVKISNADNPSFNHLTSSSSPTSGSSSSSSSSSNSAGISSAGAFKPSLSSGIPPFRYIQNSQYQPFYTTAYLQPSHAAAQIASQYSFQGAPVTHYLQTPTQVQYVSTPAVAQVPFIKFQGFGADYSAGASATSDVSSSSSVTSASAASVSTPSSHSTSGATSSHHSLPLTHQSFGAGSQLSPASVQTAVQPKDYFLYQSPTSARPVYYAQQPFLTFFVQPQAATSTNFLYQQPGVNYFYRQAPQQYLNFHGANRFTMYPTSHANQLTYLVPMAVSSPSHDVYGTGNEIKQNSPGKGTTASQQHSSSASSFTYGNKG